MASSHLAKRLVVDSIHGDIHLSAQEWNVVNTGSFQRLRKIKQLGMGHFTYPNATHTRFAHSLGVLGIMARVLKAIEGSPLPLNREDRNNLRLAALLHDIGHYPYSHVMETVDSVKLTEEAIDEPGAAKKSLNLTTSRYPSHEELGKLIVTNQQELIDAIGGASRARAVADLFTRSQAANPQLSKLIHSSLDMDRLDYLLRDSRAAGVPYGIIDINYILNNVKVSKSGMLGVSRKALPAAEQFLMARHFMHRAVYYHKTTVALEEACRQMLRRLRDRVGKNYGVPKNGGQVKDWVTSGRIGSFADGFIDGVVQSALSDRDAVIGALAACIHRRRPPRLLKEVCALEASSGSSAAVTAFKVNFRRGIKDLAKKHSMAAGRFLFWEAKPVKFEERGPTVTAHQARSLASEQEEEAIKVFMEAGGEPNSIMDIEHSVMRLCASHVFCIVRLYFVDAGVDPEPDLLKKLRSEVQDWDRAS